MCNVWRVCFELTDWYLVAVFLGLLVGLRAFSLFGGVLVLCAWWAFGDCCLIAVVVLVAAGA